MNVDFSQRRNALRIRHRIGVLLIVAGPAVALIGAVYGITRGSDKVLAMKSPTPRDLQKAFESAILTYGGIGLAISLIGLAVLFTAIVARNRLDRREYAAPQPPADPPGSP
ncbi:MAG: hypothetical protein HYY18_03115 [Planctomycetes bacterium]|nr:hypothetical protein [Planctomycetota bacterium]